MPVLIRALDEHARSGQTSALGALLIDSEMVTHKATIAAVVSLKVSISRWHVI